MSSQCFFCGPYVFLLKACAFPIVPMLFVVKPMLFFFVGSYASHTPKAMFCRWFLWVFTVKPHVLSLVSMVCIVKPLHSRGFVFVYSKATVFFAGSYAFHSKAIAFLLVPLKKNNISRWFFFLTVQPNIFRWFICFSL